MSKIHTHNLTSGLVRILVKIIEKVKSTNRNKVHLQKDLELTHNEFANLQKLRYFGLIAKYKENGIRFPGYWLITRNGGAFLRNDLQILNKVQTQDNQIKGRLGRLVKITDFFRGDIYPEAYWQEHFGTINLDQPSLL